MFFYYGIKNIFNETRIIFLLKNNANRFEPKLRHGALFFAKHFAATASITKGLSS